MIGYLLNISGFIRYSYEKRDIFFMKQKLRTIFVLIIIVAYVQQINTWQSAQLTALNNALLEIPHEDQTVMRIKIVTSLEDARHNLPEDVCASLGRYLKACGCSYANYLQKFGPLLRIYGQFYSDLEEEKQETSRYPRMPRYKKDHYDTFAEFIDSGLPGQLEGMVIMTYKSRPYLFKQIARDIITLHPGCTAEYLKIFSKYGINIKQVRRIWSEGPCPINQIELPRPDLFGYGLAIQTPLQWAAQNGYVKKFTDLIDAGASVLEEDETGRNPLMYLAKQAGTIDPKDSITMIKSANQRFPGIMTKRSSIGKSPFDILLKKKESLENLLTNHRQRLGSDVTLYEKSFQNSTALMNLLQEERITQ